jgi:hypothetical protein
MNSGTERVTESSTDADHCTECGGPIETSDWHPVTTGVDEDGSVDIYAFCSWRCRDRFDER